MSLVVDYSHCLRHLPNRPNGLCSSWCPMRMITRRALERVPLAAQKTLLARSGWSAGHQPRCATPMHTAVRVFSWYGESFKRSSDDMSDHKVKVGRLVGFRGGGSRTDVFKICSACRRRAGTFNIA
jgi:hypothetical protein